MSAKGKLSCTPAADVSAWLTTQARASGCTIQDIAQKVLREAYEAQRPIAVSLDGPLSAQVRFCAQLEGRAGEVSEYILGMIRSYCESTRDEYRVS